MTASDEVIDDNNDGLLSRESTGKKNRIGTVTLTHADWVIPSLRPYKVTRFDISDASVGGFVTVLVVDRGASSTQPNAASSSQSTVHFLFQCHEK